MKGQSWYRSSALTEYACPARAGGLAAKRGVDDRRLRSSLRPRARVAGERDRVDGIEAKRFVFEDTRKQGKADLKVGLYDCRDSSECRGVSGADLVGPRFETRLRELVEERRRPDDRVVLERERRDDELPCGKTQEIHERGAGAVHAIGVRGPAKLAQDRRRIEDVAPRALRPFAVHEACQLYVVEFAEPRAFRVEQVDTGVAAAWRKRLRFDAAPHHRGNLVELGDGSVEPAVGVAKRAQQPEDRAARAQLPRAKRIVRSRQCAVPGEKREQPIEVRGNRVARPQRCQLARDGEQRDSAAPGRGRHARSFLLPRLEQAIERVEVAQIARFTQCAVECRDVSRADRLAALAGAREVRRSKQRDGRHAREVRADEGEQHVERGGIRLRRERQRVEHLRRHAGGAEDIPRQVYIRKTLADHERHAIEPGQIAGPRSRTRPPCKARNLLFAIARRVHVRSAGRHATNGSAFALGPYFLDARQPLVNPLVKSAGQHTVGDDNIEPIEPGDARQQIPVHRVEPVLIARAIADGDDDVPPGTIGGCREDRGAHRVLVDAAGLHASPLEVAERRGKKPGLPDQSLGSPIGSGARVQPSSRQPLEVVDRF